MTSLERVATILQHKEADRVPVYPLINSISRNYCNIDYPTWSKDAALCAESILRATDDIGVDILCTLQDLSVEAADFGQEVHYPPNDAAHPSMTNRFIKDIDEYVKVQPVNPLITPRMAGQIEICDRLMSAKGKEMPVVAFVYGPLGILSMMRGQSEMFLDCLDDPDMLHPALQAITETLKDYCKALIGKGVHAIMFDTLFGSQSIMSKDLWREMEGIYMKPLSDFVHEQGAMVMIHNCGNGIYFDAHIEIMKPEAISFLYPPDDCKDFRETKEKYGHLTTLIGAVTPSWLMTATRDEVLAECKSQIDDMGKNGGFVLATGCEYPSGTAVTNAKVMVEAAKLHGKY